MKALLAILLFYFAASFHASAQNPCYSSQDFKIVVLGSSTSAGAGASHPDSAWVDRYTNYLQEINPANEVVNLGVGGYNTYRIMPTGFIPPAGRPNPDPSKNITAALAESPDAIIINMPSNDVAAGFSYAEQMFNLDTIVSIANQNNVDIWVCTTQPRNFGNQSQLDLQWEIKDSIYAYFNPYTIDFWTTIATPGYTLDPFYDSGDGTHLNDIGHGLLANRVINTPILDSLLLLPDSVDFMILDVSADASVCGDSNTVVEVVVANIGQDDFNNTTVELHSENTVLFTSEFSSQVISGGLASCTADTLQFSINSYTAGNYEVEASVHNQQDSISANDSLQIQLSTSGHPNIYILTDTLCAPGSATLYTLTSIDDHIFWYDDASAQNPVFSGALFNPFIDTTTHFYTQVVRGNLFYSETLETSLNTNINLNGTMFDLIASDSIVIDSFDVKIFSLGMQGVEVMYKTGSHLGFESNAGAWTTLGTATVDVVDNTQWTSVPIGGLSISQGDTVAIHIRMQNATSRLSYASVPSPQTRTTPELTMITGTGIGANFGTSYYPRDWSGSVHYHYGERPLGDCATDVQEVIAYVSDTELNAGNDTIIDILDTLTFDAGSGFEEYNWSTGSDSSSTVIAASDLGVGIHYIDLYATDSLGCERYDEFVVAVADLVGLDEEVNDISLAPNPTRDLLKIKAPGDAKFYLTDLNGRNVFWVQKEANVFSLKHLPQGVYLVHIETPTKKYQFRVLKIE